MTGNSHSTSKRAELGGSGAAAAAAAVDGGAAAISGAGGGASCSRSGGPGPRTWFCKRFTLYYGAMTCSGRY